MKCLSTLNFSHFMPGMWKEIFRTQLPLELDFHAQKAMAGYLSATATNVYQTWSNPNLV
jgi:hypothetical protein